MSTGFKTQQNSSGFAESRCIFKNNIGFFWGGKKGRKRRTSVGPAGGFGGLPNAPAHPHRLALHPGTHAPSRRTRFSSG